MKAVFNQVKFGRCLRAVRIFRECSMHEIARRTGVSVPTISRVEAGKKADLNTIYSLAHFSFLQVDHFIDITK
jgi:transcriptional regulator with XRE-family HTH domain